MRTRVFPEKLRGTTRGTLGDLWAKYGETPSVGNTRPERAKNTEGATANTLAETPNSQDVRPISSKWTG